MSAQTPEQYEEDGHNRIRNAQEVAGKEVFFYRSDLAVAHIRVLKSRLKTSVYT